MIIFLEPTIKLITRTFDLSKVTVILIMTAQVLFSNVVFKKDLHLNTVEFTIIFEKEYSKMILERNKTIIL